MYVSIVLCMVVCMYVCVCIVCMHMLIAFCVFLCVHAKDVSFRWKATHHNDPAVLCGHGNHLVHIFLHF